MKRPLISVIIPIYNIDKYLSSAIDSVIGQSLSFTDNIELILVDDGSKDESGAIAERYAAEYPDNIIYKRYDNGGVSRARNRGFSLSSGEYVHFFDGDDILSDNFYEKSIEFLRENKVNLVASRLMFFDKIIDSHPLNFKFHEDRIIDLNEEPDNPLIHMISCVFTRTSVENVSFDEQLTMSEDVKFLGDVLKNDRRYGVICSTMYNYRKRNDSSSAVGGKESNKDYYFTVLRNCYRYLLDEWSKPGDARFIESVILYDASYRLCQTAAGHLTGDQAEEYKELLLDILSLCSDVSIVKDRFLSTHQKVYILKKKYGKQFNSKITKGGVDILFDDLVLHRAKDNHIFIDFIQKLDDGKYKIEGYVKGFAEFYDIQMKVNQGTFLRLSGIERYQRQEAFLGDIYNHGDAFEYITELSPGDELSFSIGDNNLSVETGQYTGLGALKWTYRNDDTILLKKARDTIQVIEYSISQHVFLELRMLVQILLNWRIGTVKERLKILKSRNLTQLGGKARLLETVKPFFFSAEAIFYIPRAILLRTCYYVANSFKKRPIWIVSDRGMAAGDNGEALFRYIRAQKDCPADVYFVISKKSKDYSRLQELGNILNQDSLRYKLKFLQSDLIISSQADVETTNPFLRMVNHYSDLFKFKFVFLQHGIIRHNHASWLSRFEKNIHLFVTSAKKEYDSMLRYPYYYDKEAILLSGLPRYDLLNNHPQGKLILAPTYRRSLVKDNKTDKNGARKYDPSFKDSLYRNFYNDFMNDSRVVGALKESGMRGELYLHPTLSAQLNDFTENERFTVMDFPYDYKKAFEEGNLLVSDHSSVVFDFAYLQKPVAYAYFDVEDFFKEHTYTKSDFFDDVEDGFGEVYYDYDTLVSGVVEMIKEGCIMDDRYKTRVKDFFFRIDKNNCKRVYDTLVKD